METADGFEACGSSTTGGNGLTRGRMDLRKKVVVGTKEEDDEGDGEQKLGGIVVESGSQRSQRGRRGDVGDEDAGEEDKGEGRENLRHVGDEDVDKGEGTKSVVAGRICGGRADLWRWWLTEARHRRPWRHGLNSNRCLGGNESWQEVATGAVVGGDGVHRWQWWMGGVMVFLHERSKGTLDGWIPPKSELLGSEL